MYLFDVSAGFAVTIFRTDYDNYCTPMLLCTQIQVMHVGGLIHLVINQPEILLAVMLPSSNAMHLSQDAASSLVPRPSYL